MTSAVLSNLRRNGVTIFSRRAIMPSNMSDKIPIIKIGAKIDRLKLMTEQNMANGPSATLRLVSKNGIFFISICGSM
jgi:hypothetical protein